jgi:ribonuclease HII
MFDLEYFLQLNQKNSYLAGVDEVGRGPLAGPVVACTVLFEQIEKNQIEFEHFLELLSSFQVTDSKKINEDKRKRIIENLSIEIIAHQIMNIKISNNSNLKYFIQEISVDEIDNINILNASLKAMKVSFESIIGENGILLIDGNKKFSTEKKTNLVTVIKGDSKSLLIGLASIIAKEYRDQLMQNLDNRFPEYGWKSNAGYGTKAHLDGINKFGITEHHRKSFKGVKEVYEQRHGV